MANSSKKSDSMVGQILGGRYRLDAVLGSGGMGTVYRAHQENLSRDVAVKLIKPNLIEDDNMIARFKQEAQLIAKLNHPNIVTIHDFGSTKKGEFFLVMELLSGTSLNSVLAKRGKIPFVESLGIVRQIASALSAAHEAGVIHRDLKPDNIVTLADGTVKVLDFGVAKVIDTRSTAALTGTNVLIGTPGYMAPELIMDGVSTDPRSDLYALGLLWLEMLRGQASYEATTPAAVLVKQATEPPPELDPALGIPDEVAAVIYACVERDPDKRPANADVLQRSLQALTGTDTPAQTPRNVSLPPDHATEATNTPSTGFIAENKLPDPADDDDITDIMGPETAMLQPSSMVQPPPKKSRLGVGLLLAAVAVVGVSGAFLFMKPQEAADPGPSIVSKDLKMPKDSPAPAVPADDKPQDDIEPGSDNGDDDPAPVDDIDNKGGSNLDDKIKVAATIKKKRIKQKRKRLNRGKHSATSKPAPKAGSGQLPKLNSTFIQKNLRTNLNKVASACRNSMLRTPDNAQKADFQTYYCPSYGKSKPPGAREPIDIVLKPDGTVVSAKFRRSAARTTDLGKCVAASIKKSWKFPAFQYDKEQAKISYSVEFKRCTPIDNKCIF